MSDSQEAQTQPLAPFPWTPESQAYSSYDLPERFWKTTVRGRLGDYVAAVYGDSEADSQTHAHLIAAAPEMYEALEELDEFLDLYVDVIDGDDGYGGNQPQANKEMKLQQMVRAALAKAQGVRL